MAMDAEQSEHCDTTLADTVIQEDTPFQSTIVDQVLEDSYFIEGSPDKPPHDEVTGAAAPGLAQDSASTSANPPVQAEVGKPALVTQESMLGDASEMAPNSPHSLRDDGTHSRERAPSIGGHQSEMALSCTSSQHDRELADEIAKIEQVDAEQSLIEVAPQTSSYVPTGQPVHRESTQNVIPGRLLWPGGQFLQDDAPSLSL